ncbi:MAG: PqqD family protein [Acidobacteria bacterium]|nr:MAG: PqqD family protein [Acidobacteriota bacterium]REJ99289.1 MAG: PqqD family protein [Acidobacteriota bacterium]REK15990.1 MAG: PqqD family protein [Acidobacteriota bacterium]REK43671.1 MAG: PqqD family protein [Acidobacteriota bacterium]
MRPIARTNDLVVKRDTGQLYIEDVVNRKYIFLNPTSAYVWEKCDGKKDESAIAQEMGKDLGVDVSESFVSQIMNNLFAEELLVPEFM